MLDDLLPLSPSALRARMEAGFAIDAAALAGWEYEGVSLGLPHWVERLAWKTFKKVFLAEGDAIRGWNVGVVQAGLDGPFEDRKKRGERVTYGHYGLRSAIPGEALGGAYHHGLVIDYGAVGSGLDPGRRIRDPLVALRDGDPTLLLGASVLQLGSLGIRTPSFFLLRRGQPLTYNVAP